MERPKQAAILAPRGAEGHGGAFGQPRAQLRWALGHKENKIFIFFGLAARTKQPRKSKNLNT